MEVEERAGRVVINACFSLGSGVPICRECIRIFPCLINAG